MDCGRDFSSLGPLGQAAWAVYALERYAAHSAPDVGDWEPLFQMLWSFDCISHLTYLESLLLSVIPEYLLDTPYTPQDYVQRPHEYCGSKADYSLYHQPPWTDSPWPELLKLLPRNSFGYLHPKPEEHGFLGISRDSYDRLSRLYRHCTPECREAVDRLLQALSEFILNVADGVPGCHIWLYRAVLSLGIEPPPMPPFRIYRRRFLQDLGSERLHTFFLGRPRPRTALSLPHIFV